MTLRVLVRISAASLIALLCAGAMLASWRIDRIRVGGPIQVKLQQASDLIADILPPPAYVIEPYLEATLLVRDPSSYAEHAGRLARLRKDYDARQVYWRASDLDPALKTAITTRTDAPARLFWRELDDTLLPSVRRGDAAAAAASYRRLSAAYAAHRRMIDETVTAAAAYQTKLNADAKSELRLGIAVLIALASAIVSMAIGAALYLVRRVVVPLGEVATATTDLAAGGDCAVPHLARVDELGTLAVAVERFRVAAETRRADDARSTADQQAVSDLLAVALRAMAAGDLTGRGGRTFPPSYAAIGANLDMTVTTLREMIEAVIDGTGQIGTASSEIAAASDDLAARSKRNAADLEETAAALGDIDARLKATTQVSTDTADRADRTIATVDQGRASARGAVDAMVRVAGSARGIDEVIGGLDKIAFQTRVLAMNAAIEAGREGEAGRGFAIVADLVGALAIRAEAEARQARERLTVTQVDIEAAVGAVSEVDGALVTIAAAIGEVHAMLGTIARDNRAQSVAFTDVATTVAGMDRSTRQNAAMVEQTSAAARTLASEVGSLVAKAAAFDTGRREVAPVVRRLEAA
ncbi:methyl-accepting chemotaxis protein [uncultured Sphingomonas sp.]|uniref:methyl-accepting chemotaxis protein n=1 Tax=uncultured Sphingomonas sp. TaxID=158754 RepID=UPI0035CA4DBB